MHRQSRWQLRTTLCERETSIALVRILSTCFSVVGLHAVDVSKCLVLLFHIVIIVVLLRYQESQHAGSPVSLVDNNGTNEQNTCKETIWFELSTPPLPPHPQSDASVRSETDKHSDRFPLVLDGSCLVVYSQSLAPQYLPTELKGTKRSSGYHRSMPRNYGHCRAIAASLPARYGAHSFPFTRSLLLLGCV